MPDLVRPDMLHSMDLDEVLGAMRRVRVEGINK